MPELPEVEEVRRTLEPCLLGRPLRAIRVLRPDFITPSHAPLTQLIGGRFTQTLRHGKKLFCLMEDGRTLLFHLGMSGRIEVVPAHAPLKPHTHLALELADGREIRCVDPRRFGGVWYYPTLQAALAAEVEGRLGPDALTLQSAHLAHWRKTKGKLKARLLTQRDVAGLGNIYVDEALWMAQLHPLQRVARITPAQIDTLVQAIHTLLRRSIALGGTTLRDYRNVADQAGAFQRQLQAYGRVGEPCRRCGAPLASLRVVGRSTVFCPACQKRH